MEKTFLTNADVRRLAKQQAEQISGWHPGPFNLFPIPRGGVPAAYAIVSELKNVTLSVPKVVDDPNEANFLVDDLIDSGKTYDRWMKAHPHIGLSHFLSLIDKRQSDRWGWVVFPWERKDADTDESATDNVLRILEYIGEDPKREGLIETPRRVVKAWDEWFSGYKQDPAALFKSFTDGAQKNPGDEMVLQSHIPVYSMCEHHMAPFFGFAHIAYIPEKKILGLSKFDRVVDCFMRRLQVQERLTEQIAEAFEEHLKPKGVGVVVRARHMCKESRGVRNPGTITTTSAIRGAFRTNPAARAEFMSLVESAEKARL